MADKLAELKAALEGTSNEGLRLVLEFSRYLLKKQSQAIRETQKKGATQGQRASERSRG